MQRKVNIPKLYAAYFKKAKDGKMSFVSVKKELLNKIKKNEWYNKENQQLIDLPEDLRKRLGIKSEGLIDIKDIDKVVTLFYK